MGDWNAYETITSPTKAELAVRKMEADGKAKGIVHINHGMAEHCLRYARFATALSKAGYHVIAHDHRGHGYTKSLAAPLGRFSNKDGWQKVLADCHAVNGHAQQTWPDLPVIMFGHSMGSIITLTYAIRHSKTLAGAAMWNSGVDTGALMVVFRLLLKAERMLKGSDVPSALAEKLTFNAWNARFKPNRTAFDWLSRDDGEVDKYIADPLCGFTVSNGLWLDVTEMILIGADDTQLTRMRSDLPVNLLGGEADPCSDNGKAMVRLATRMNRIGVHDVSCKTLPETRHETLNEINREAETRDFIAWLDQRFG